MSKILFSDARSLIREGDVLLFKGGGLLGKIIQGAGEGKYSHVAVASRHLDNGNSFWECVEFREWLGGRTINLRQYVKMYPGDIDVYRPISHHTKIKYDKIKKEFYEEGVVFDGKAVTNEIRRMTGLPYGWRRILWLFKYNIPMLGLMFSLRSYTNDEEQEPIYPVCSTVVAHSFNKIGYDLLHNKADEVTEPSDISRSPLLYYVFTLDY